LIDLEQNWFGDIVPHELEARMIQQVHDVLTAAREEIVETQNLMAFANQPVAKMRS
jgi:hypothetical protein